MLRSMFTQMKWRGPPARGPTHLPDLPFSKALAWPVGAALASPTLHLLRVVQPCKLWTVRRPRTGQQKGYRTAAPLGGRGTVPRPSSQSGQAADHIRCSMALHMAQQQSPPLSRQLTVTSSTGRHLTTWATSDTPAGFCTSTSLFCALSRCSQGEGQRETRSLRVTPPCMALCFRPTCMCDEGNPGDLRCRSLRWMWNGPS